MLRNQAIVAAVALVAAAGPALAGEARVLVWPRAPGVDTTEAVAAARDAGFEVVPFAPIADRLTDRGARARAERDAVLDGVQDALAAMRDAYLAQRFDDMAELAARALARAIALPHDEHVDVLWDLTFQHGVAHVARGDAAGARDAFDLALSLAPNRRPPAGVYGPDVAAAFAAVVTAREAVAARPVRLEVDPADATVTVDGIAVVDPSQPVSLAPGRHAVFARAPGFATRAAVVDTRDGAAVDLRLPRDRGATAIDRMGAAWARGAVSPELVSGRAAILAVAAEVGAAAVLVVDRDPARGTATVQLLVTSGAVEPLRARTIRDAATAALARLAPDGTLRAGAPPPDAPPPPPPRTRSSSVLSKWWFWTAVGVVAASAVTVGIVAADEPDRIRILAPGP